jgi:hypothetical protein
MATVGKVLLAVIVLLACFSSTTFMMSYLYALDSAAMAF